MRRPHAAPRAFTLTAAAAQMISPARPAMVAAGKLAGVKLGRTG